MDQSVWLRDSDLFECPSHLSGKHLDCGKFGKFQVFAHEELTKTTYSKEQTVKWFVLKPWFFGIVCLLELFACAEIFCEFLTNFLPEKSALFYWGLSEKAESHNLLYELISFLFQIGLPKIVCSVLLKIFCKFLKFSKF